MGVRGAQVGGLVALRVLATGPESSGTKWVTKLLAEAGADAVHRSQPEGPDWVDLRAMLDHPASGPTAPVPPFDAAVVVVRGRLAHVRSQVRRNIESSEDVADARRRAALARIAPVLGDPRVTVVTYESLAHVAERRHLLASLGLDDTAADRVPWTDQNLKHY